MSKKIFTFLFLCLMGLTLVSCKKEAKITITVETNMTAGETYQVVLATENLGKNAVIDWNVSDPTVASLNEETLKIEALKEGSFTLSATAQEGEVSASVNITVQPIPLETYTISYDLNGGQWGTLEGATSFVENSPATLVDPVREGYEFLGWYEGETKVETLENKNYTLVAKWEAKVYYTVTYSLNGGSWNGAAGATQFEENKPFTLPTPVKADHEFLGWYEGETKVETLENKNYTLVAKWEEIIYEVWYDLTIDLDGGSFADGVLVPSTFLEGSELEIPTPSKDGFVFLGWKTYDSSKSLLWEITDTNHNINLIAVWGSEKFYVGANWGYTTLAAAVAAAQDGDTIVVMPGTYEGAEINKQVTIQSYNWLDNIRTKDTEIQTVFTTDLIFAADNITINGVVITEKAKFMSKTGMNIANPTIINSIVRESTVNANYQTDKDIAPFNFTNVSGYSITNLTIDNCRIEERNTGRPMIAYLSYVDGLTIKNSEFLGGTIKSNYNDGIKTDTAAAVEYGVKGNVTITGNLFQNYHQYVIWFVSYGAGNYVVENNTFNTVGQTADKHAAVNFITCEASESEEVNISVKYNTIEKGIMMVRIDTADMLTDENAKINVNYNSLINCAGSYYILNGTAVALDLENNWWGTTTLEATKFSGVAVPTAYYSSAEDVPTKGEVEGISYTIEYDLNGGSWDVVPYTLDECIEDLVADLCAYYGKTLTPGNISGPTYGASVKMTDFFFTHEIYKEKWGWLATFMMQTREVDPNNSDGYANLLAENDPAWRFEVCGFTGKCAKDSWPYSSDYSIREVQENFEYAAKDLGEVIPGVDSYAPGVETKLNAATYEGKVFQYWLSEDNQIFYDVIPANIEGDLKLKAIYIDEVVPTAFEITNLPSNGIALYDTYQLQWLFTPLDTYNQTLEFASSDESVFTIDKDGLITAVGVGEADLFVSVLGNSDLDVLLTVKVYIPAQFKVEYETESYVKPTETIKINASYVKDEVENTDLNWESLNPEIATVEEGTVTGVAEGVATIRVSLKDDASIYYDIVVTVLPANMSDVLADIIASHESNVFVKYDLGIGAGTPVYYYDVYGSVNKILFNDPLSIDDKYLADGNAKYEGQDRTMSSIEFITVHYTGNMKKGSNASANAGYFVQDTHDTSIHYTTGNDGVFHCMDDDQKAAHAGDSDSINHVGAFEWLDTGVAYTAGASLNPVVSVSDDYYYEINGIKTNIKLPDPYSYNSKAVHQYVGNGQVKSGTAGTTLPAENYFNQMGFKFIEKNGNYYMAKTWWCYSQVSEGRICSVGGNSNSIGIESCVDEGSDLWLTWQRTAQLVAKLLLDNNLDINRVVGHHFYTAKDCPQPLLENDLEIWYEFLELVEIEYALLTKYADYEISMEVLSGEGLADNGRVTQAHEGQIVTYKVTVTNKSTKESETITLASAIAGDYFK